MQEIPYEELENVRNRELALVRAPRDDQSRTRNNPDDDNAYAVRRRDAQDNNVDHYVRRTVRERLPEDGYGVSRRSYDTRRDGNVVPYTRSNDGRRRDHDSDSDSSRERRRRRRDRRARSERPKPKQEDDEGRLWYSGEKRCDANFMERHFDSSYDGLLAAAAGAAIGAITARRFAGEEKRGWKTVGGAVAGAAAVNLAENHWRIYTEEKEEKKEKLEQAEQPFELGAEAMQEM